MASITTIGFDADDTLWHNERFFKLTQDRFQRLLADYAPPHHLAEHLMAAEKRNLRHYGFGIKGFVLSMIETALDVTDQQVPGSVIQELLDAGQEMLRHPIELLPLAQETVETLRGRYRLILITKGDLLDQERKLAQSGLGELFHAVEIVSDKTTPVYTSIFARHAEGADRALMVGNSLKSDVIPAIEAGGWGVHIPHDHEWELEAAEAPTDHPRFHTLENLGALPQLLGQLSNS